MPGTEKKPQPDPRKDPLKMYWDAMTKVRVRMYRLNELEMDLAGVSWPMVGSARAISDKLDELLKLLGE